MTTITTEKIEELRRLAKAATPQNFDSAQDIRKPDENGFVECPCCDGEGAVKLSADYCNYDDVAIGVQFYGIGRHFENAEAYYRAANPATILALLDLAQRAMVPQPQGQATDMESAIDSMGWHLDADEREDMRRLLRAYASQLALPADKLSDEVQELKIQNQRLSEALGEALNGPTFMGEPVKRWKKLAEHSGCGRNPQREQVSARLHPGDMIIVVRGELGAILEREEK